MKFRFNQSTAAVAGLLFFWSAAGAQQPPPIGGLTGTVALEGTVQKIDRAIGDVVVKTVDGIEHLFHLTERTVVHGGKAHGDDALRGLDEGSRVVVHYTVEGARQTASEVDRIAVDGLKTTEGVVTNVDRHAKTMSIRLDDGSRQTLELTDRAASDVGKDIEGRAVGTAKVVVYFTDEAGRRVAHYFKRIA